MTEDQLRVDLLRNGFLYEACLEWVASLASQPEACLAAMTRTSLLAWHHHPGRFADGALENLALRLGREQPLSGAAAPALGWSGRRTSKTLHVATELHPVGGHTRVLAKWASRDLTSSHAVVLTRQRGAVPEFFERIIADSGGTIVRLPVPQPLLSAAGALRRLASGFDRVFLHSHPDDPVPTVAFALPGGPPVAMFNHAHFSFSLGPAVSDLVINTLESFRAISKQRRFARQTACLSALPGLARATTGPIDKDAAKASIGMDPSRPVALTIGQESYYRPMAGYDFFRTARKLLDRHPTLQFVFVGPRAESQLVPAALRGDPRCRFTGPVVDPIPYLQAADVLLESFPMPSLGGPLEGVVHGEAFPVPVYGPSESILRVTPVPILAYDYRPRDEEDYVDYFIGILGRLPWARERARADRLSMVALDESWESQLATLNQSLDRLAHQPQELPPAPLIDSYDSRVLAQLFDLDLGGLIDSTLPFARGARAHFAAVSRGYSRPRALSRIVRRAWRMLRPGFPANARVA